MKNKSLCQWLVFAFIIVTCSRTFATQADPEVDRIYQFFVPSEASKDRGNLGMYLWIPPNTPKIRAVMVAMHNGLPINILQSAPVREVCRKHGIAQILIYDENESHRNHPA